MDKLIKNILKKIEDNGFEAYIVGGYVRDYLLNNESHDVDIATNALLKDLKNIFNIGKSDDCTYGSYHIQTKKYDFDITTYREESKYDKRRPTKIKYVNNLISDITRRDFTINSLCMNRNGQIIDLLNGKNDIFNKEIKVIGDIKKKFTEDPLRMLRAIRFAITLNFKIEREALLFIINNKSLINDLSYKRKKDELDLILISDNALEGLKYLKDLNLDDVLDLDYNNVAKVPDLLGMWAQIKTKANYPFNKSEQLTIKSIKEIISYGKIDNNVLFNYDLYLSQVAGCILNISKKEISHMYSKMPIHSYKEIKVSNLDIIHFLEIKPSCLVKNIMDDIKNAILNNKLNNKKSDIKKYLMKNREVWLNGQ